MKKLIWLVAGVSTLFAQALVLDVEILDAKKPDGTSWDAAGGAPDILIRIDGKYYSGEQCHDTYRCDVPLIDTISDTPYIEVYDKDAFADDLIAKGTCDLTRKICKLQDVTIRITHIPEFAAAQNKIVLADARLRLAREIQIYLDTLLARQSVSHKEIVKLIEMLERMKRYGVTPSETLRRKIDTLRLRIDDPALQKTLRRFVLPTPTIV